MEYYSIEGISKFISEYQTFSKRAMEKAYVMNRFSPADYPIAYDEHMFIDTLNYIVVQSVDVGEVYEFNVPIYFLSMTNDQVLEELEGQKLEKQRQEEETRKKRELLQQQQAEQLRKNKEEVEYQKYLKLKEKYETNI